MKATTLLSKPVFITMLLLVVIGTGCRGKKTQEDQWQDLFDGKTLNGWKILGGQADYSVEDEMIVCNTELDIGGGYLVTEKSYDDFILELDVKIDTSLNSGIQCRSKIWEKDTVTTYLAGDEAGTIRQRKWDSGYVWGYQVEIDPSSRAWSGGLYEPGNRGWIVTLKDNEEARGAFNPADWNHFRILMDGSRIQIWVNGITTLDTTDDMSSSGFIGLQFHQANRQWQVGKKSYFRNIKIKEL